MEKLSEQNVMFNDVLKRYVTRVLIQTGVELYADTYSNENTVLLGPGMLAALVGVTADDIKAEYEESSGKECPANLVYTYSAVLDWSRHCLSIAPEVLSAKNSGVHFPTLCEFTQ